MSLARRRLLLTLAMLPAGAAAAPALEAAQRALVGDAAIEAGGMVLRLPALAEHGGQVPVTVTVESPMTAADHVTHIHLLATRNPTPGLVSFTLSPALSRAEVQTRIRLAEDQQVVALAVLADGRVRRAVAETRVVTGGCIG
ncbi:MAG: thiosulfate oxidation carrier protein SoxY [Paracraurococcus sp.]|jgi:sulfur-oxidizing protein SoxY